jgi:hypothetical protein
MMEEATSDRLKVGRYLNKKLLNVCGGRRNFNYYTRLTAFFLLHDIPYGYLYRMIKQ